MKYAIILINNLKLPKWTSKKTSITLEAKADQAVERVTIELKN